MKVFMPDFEFTVRDWFRAGAGIFDLYGWQNREADDFSDSEENGYGKKGSGC